MQPHDNMYPMMSFAFDVVLLIIGIWMAVMVAKLQLGGAISKTVSRVVVGSLILGFAHLVETGMDKLGVPTDMNEVIHRVLILIGFTWLAFGINALVKTFGGMKR